MFYDMKYYIYKKTPLIFDLYDNIKIETGQPMCTHTHTQDIKHIS